MGNRIIRLFQIIVQTWRHAQKAIHAETPSVRKKVMADWATEMLRLCHVKVKHNPTHLEGNYIFVGNHTSYLDIPVLMTLQSMVFVAKKELADWPIFGTAMKSVDTVFVDRTDRQSRNHTADAIAPYIKEKKLNVCIFPSGTTTLSEEKPWRWGALTLAQKYQIPVIPFRLKYTPARKAAYLMEDSFLPHLWELLGQSQIEVEVEFGEPIQISDAEKETDRWWKWSREKLNSSERLAF
jgi:1-acyl-sn-glycerol-3-phosphate acyltransferase